MTLILFLIVLILYTQLIRLQPVEASRQAALDRVPIAFADYVGSDRPMSQQALDVLGADQAMYREYRKADGRPILVFLGYFGSQKENSQIHSPKHCYPGGGWAIYDELFADVEFNDEHIRTKALLLTNGKMGQLVYYWFHTDSGIVTNEYALKWDQMTSALLRRSQRATFIRFSTPLDRGGQRDAAERDLKEFVAAVAPHLIAALNGEETRI